MSLYTLILLAGTALEKSKSVLIRLYLFVLQHETFILCNQARLYKGLDENISVTYFDHISVSVMEDPHKTRISK